MTSHKDEALRLIEEARNTTLRTGIISNFERAVIRLALDHAAREVEAIEELKRPRRAKKEAGDEPH